MSENSGRNREIGIPPMTDTVIKDFIHRKVDEAGANGVVLGLSGGVDSALVATLCRLAIGAERVKAVIMPTSDSDPKDRELAVRFAEESGIEYQEVDITPAVNALKEMLMPDYSGTEAEKKALGNIKARVRMTVLFHIAGTEGRLVMGTGNKSELLTGYFTKFGDGGSDFAPIGDLYKTQVWELSKHLGVPEYIVSRKPTAGLWPGQTDEEEMGMDYGTLDTILQGIEMLKTCGEIAEENNLPVELVRRVDGMVKKTVHKRKMPLIPKVGQRTIGLDWRE